MVTVARSGLRSVLVSRHSHCTTPPWFEQVLDRCWLNNETPVLQA
jgi:hypothetical protein